VFSGLIPSASCCLQLDFQCKSQLYRFADAILITALLLGPAKELGFAFGLSAFERKAIKLSKSVADNGNDGIGGLPVGIPFFTTDRIWSSPTRSTIPTSAGIFGGMPVLWGWWHI
jgi:hypothetical protein